MGLSFLEWAFNSHSSTVDVVIKMIINLKWTETNLASKRKIEVLANDALVMGLNQQNKAIFQSVSSNWLFRHKQGFILQQIIPFFYRK